MFQQVVPALRGVAEFKQFDGLIGQGAAVQVVERHFAAGGVGQVVAVEGDGFFEQQAQAFVFFFLFFFLGGVFS